MRVFLTWVFAVAFFSLTSQASASGVPPRDSARDYPVQGQADAATIAAAIVLKAGEQDVLA